MALLGDIGDLASGKTSLSIDVPPSTIIYLSLGVFVAVLLSVIIANELTK